VGVATGIPRWHAGVRGATRGASNLPACWTSSARPARWTGRGPAWTASACARFGGDHVGANPVDRAKPGSKLHLAVDGGGLPLSLLVTGANTNDSLVFEALLGDIPPVRTPAGRRRRRPEKVHADKANDHRRCRAYLTRRGIKVRIARCGIEPSQRLGRHRWKAERTIAWLAGCRRLRIRYDRTPSGSLPSCCWPATGCATTGCPARPPPGYHDPALGSACPLRAQRHLTLTICSRRNHSADQTSVARRPQTS
jgi:transposase